MNNLYDELRINECAAALLDHWLDLRAPGTVCPHKKDFMPMKMRRFLPDVFLAEWVDEDNIIIRVAGTRTADVTRRDTTGNNLLDNSIPENKPILQEFYRKMRSGQLAGLSKHRISRAVRPTNALCMQLPLLDANGQVNFFVGVIKASPLETSELMLEASNENSTNSITVKHANLSVRREPTEIKLG